MKKRIWMINHYATNMYYDAAGRHQSLAKHLVKKGYEVVIFCANTIHNSNDSVDLGDALFIEKEGPDDVKYVFVKTSPYKGNGLSRIMNMVEFWINVKKVAKKIAKKSGKPNILLSSSVHPLALVAGIQLSKCFKIPCISEVRDLWPETFVEFGMLKRTSIIAKILYCGEHWIYKKSNRLIFTMPGGKNYIIDKAWQKDINIDKVHYLNNGIDLEDFDYNKENYIVEDEDLNNDKLFKVVYTGSIRTANQVHVFAEMAKLYKSKGINDVIFIIYGDGDQREKIQEYCQNECLDNIVFKGRVQKKYIPYIVSSGDLNIVTDQKNNLGKYGVSWNKLFEYMASGKPTLANYDMGNYNLIEEYNFGIAREFDSIEDFAEAVLQLKEASKEEYENFSANARKAAREFNYMNLADKLEEIILLALNAK